MPASEFPMHASLHSALPSQPPCPICSSELKDTYPGVESADTFLAGEVFSVQESIYTPIEHILSDPKVSGLTDAEANNSRTSLEKFQTRARATVKSRPCILMFPIHDQSFHHITNAMLCVMTTLNGLQYENLPEIFHFFGILVHPNHIPTGNDSTRFHLHALPPWPMLKKNRHQLIIAYRFRTTRKLDERWWTPEVRRAELTMGSTVSLSQDPALFRTATCERQGMSFGKYAMSQLRDKCDNLRDEWIQKCRADRTFAIEREREYRAWQNLESQLDDRSFMGDTFTRRSRKSQASAARRIVPPTRGEGSILHATIFEDQESVFHVTQEVSVDADARGWEVQAPKKGYQTYSSALS
ncbi:hypothetical protein ACG7TL_008641 [Trametes sanguinea]